MNMTKEAKRVQKNKQKIKIDKKKQNKERKSFI